MRKVPLRAFIMVKKIIDPTNSSKNKKTPASKLKKAHRKATRKSPRELKGKERYNIAVMGQVSTNLRFDDFKGMCGSGPDKGYYEIGVNGGRYTGKAAKKARRACNDTWLRA